MARKPATSKTFKFDAKLKNFANEYRFSKIKEYLKMFYNRTL